MGNGTGSKAIFYIGKGLDATRDLPSLSLGETLIGIDRGAYLLSKANKRMDYAIGDFDSVSEEEFRHIEEHADKVIRLPIKKDDTDTAYAYRLFHKEYDSIDIYGAIEGKRIEHFLGNLSLLRDDEKVRLIGRNSIVLSKKASQNPILLRGREFYWSFFAMEESVLSLEGFAYPLSDYRLLPFDPLCLSNELLLEEGILRLKKGALIVVQTKKGANSEN